MDTTHADMRIEVVKRELNQGALAGLGMEITDYAAHLILAALNSYDAHALEEAYTDGYRDGFRAGTKNGLMIQQGRRPHRLKGNR